MVLVRPETMHKHYSTSQRYEPSTAVLQHTRDQFAESYLKWQPIYFNTNAASLSVE